MGLRPNCRSCRHCHPPSGRELGWCKLRQLAIHPDLAGELWCHHWTARPPRLPTRPTLSGGASAPLLSGNQQLSLTAVLEDD